MVEALKVRSVGRIGCVERFAMNISFTRLEREQALEIASWRYDEPYAVYDYRRQSAEEVVESLIAPTNQFFAVLNDDQLIGFRSFGPDGRVPGYEYNNDFLDTGGGLRPELTGKGLGSEVLRLGLEFGAQEFGRKRFRVTVASFNQRALRVCAKVGFAEVDRFFRSGDGKEFVVLCFG